MIKEIQNSIQALKDNGVILCPTDTIWGLSCDATSQKAVEKLIELKQRPKTKSFIILLHTEGLLPKYVRTIPDASYDLIDYSEIPLTIIYPDAYNISPLLKAEDGSIGIRIVKKGFIHELIKKFNKPLVSTSVNISGEPAAINPEQANKDLLAKVDYVVNLPVPKNIQTKPSSIIKLDKGGQIKIIRK